MILDIEKIRAESIVGFTDYSGIEYLEVGEGYAKGRVKILPCHLNPSGAVHGGLIFCLGDVIGGIASRTLETFPTTVNSTISYMRPLLHQKEIIAEANVVKHGKTMDYVEIRIYNDQMEEAVRLQATYYNMMNRK